MKSFEEDEDEDDDWNDFDDDDDDWDDDDEEIEVGKIEKAREPPATKPEAPGKAAQKNRKMDAQKKPSSLKKEKGGRKARGFRGHPAYIWSTRILTTLLIVMILFAPIAALEIPRDDLLGGLKDMMRPYREFPEWTNVSIRINYNVEASGGFADEINIQVAPPFDIPSSNSDETFVAQDVLDVQLSTETVETRVYAPLPFGDFNTKMNQISGWKLTHFRGEASFEAEFHAKLYYHSWDIDEEDSGTIADIEDRYKDLYLDDEWEVDDNDDGIPEQYRYHPGSPIVKSTAHTLTDGEDTVLEKVKAIYDWIQDNFNYTRDDQREIDRIKYGAYPKWPEGCIADWYGDCDDQSLLMASLCRAVGIPAWLEIGYLYEKSTGQWGGHGWFNVVIPVRQPGGGFKQVVAPIDPVNSEFLYRDPYRITDWVDNGTSFIDEDGDLTFNLDYYYNYFSETSSHSTRVSSQPPIYTSLKFEEHGRVKEYVKSQVDYAQVDGSQKDFGLPTPNPLLLAPLGFLLLVPAVRTKIARRRT